MNAPDFDILLGEYLQLRRSLGFKLEREESRLRAFAAFLRRAGASRITSALALEFAGGPAGRAPATKQSYLGAIGGFALYLRGMGFDAGTPPPGALGRHRNRPPPYIYTQKEIARLLALARRRAPCAPGERVLHCALKPRTLHTLIGLLAATGMRLGEALKLRHGHIDWKQGVISIGEAKFLKSRLVPVHPATLKKLRAYASERERFFSARGRSPQPLFFVTRNGRALTRGQVYNDFRALLHRAGLRKAGERRGPRLHDLRHRFAVVTLLRWHKSGRAPGCVMPLLATYLGHGKPSATYWYLSNTPGLMAAAKKRLDARWEGAAR